MNDQGFERLLESVVDDGPRVVDERVVELALAEVRTTRQRGALAALLGRYTVQFRLVTLTGGAAAALLIALLAFNLFATTAAPGPTATPSPSPTPTAAAGSPGSRTLTTQSFAVPLTFKVIDFFESQCDGVSPLVTSEVPWTIQDTPSVLSVIACEPSSNRLTVIRQADALLVGDGGEEVWPDDVRAWLEAQSGIALQDSIDLSANIGGQDRAAILFSVNPAVRASGSVLFRTSSGETLPLAAGTSLVGLFEVPDGLGKPLVVVISAATADWGSWLGDLHSTAESLRTP